MKAICSFSGGLDSMLAVKLMLEQGIEVEGIYFRTGFGGCGDNEDLSLVKERAKDLDITLRVVDVSEELIKIIRKPKFGFGKNMNPCIDCHSLFFKKCGEYMRKLGCSFIATGEVLGERPMSQRKMALQQIDNESGLKGFILRPLSAKRLAETIPEKKGWVDRKKLLDISGRSRKIQRSLAEKYALTSFPNAAGGCLLTEKDFSRKLRDLMKYSPGITTKDISDLRSGRHFRLSDDVKFIIGRNEEENIRLLDKASSKESCFMTVDVPGPAGVIIGKMGKNEKLLASSIIAAYSDAHNGDEIKMKIRNGRSGEWREILVIVPPKKDMEKFLI